MTQRTIRLAWLLVLIVPIASAPGFPGRGGGGRGGGGFGGGGMRGGYGGGGFSHNPSFSAPRASPVGGGYGGVGRPSTLPSGPQLGVGQPGIANRTGINTNVTGATSRDVVGSNVGNRLVAGGNTTINRGDVNAVRQTNVAGARVDPGYGVGPPVRDTWRGAYGAYHRGWVNGYWHGYHTNPRWSWGSFAVGAAAGVAAWGLGSSIYSWGYMPYANPYYVPAAPVVVEQPVVVAGGQPVAVPVAAYDYSQPIDTQAPPPEPAAADRATATFDSARAAFQAGDYSRALQLTDQALATLPNDATLHEFRALCLFALQKYEQAAAPLYAVLSVGPGWDWTTLVGLYPGVDVYTQQLRALEAYTEANPKSAAGHFVLAYHYLTQDHPDAAVGQLKQVVSLAPADTLSAQLLKQISGGAVETPEAQPAPTGPPPGATPVDPGRLAGSWSASPAQDTAIRLTIRGDGTFAWKVTSQGKTRDITGKWSLTNGVLTLAQDGQAGALVGNVAWQAQDRFTFRAIGTGPDDDGLTFIR